MPAIPHITRSSFWNDPVVRKLSPNAKLLFLYLFTCEQSHYCGIYVFERAFVPLYTGMTEKETTKAFNELLRENRITWDIDNGVIFVHHMLTHQFPGGRPDGVLKHLTNHFKSLHNTPLINNLLQTILEQLPVTYNVIAEQLKQEWMERIPEPLKNGSGTVPERLSNRSSPSPSSSSSLSSLSKEERTSKQDRAKNQTEIRLKDEEEANKVIKACSEIRFSYRGASIPPATKKMKAQAVEVMSFAREQFRLKEWPDSDENVYAYIGLLYEAFMNYDSSLSNGNSEDFIIKSDYHFSGFHYRLAKWAEKIDKVTDSTGRKVYIPLKVPEDVLKFDTCGSGCDHSTARVEAFIKRNKNHAKQIREFKAMAKDGLKYDEYMKEKTGDGEEKADNDGQENTVSAGS